MVATDFQMISSKYIITILSIASFILSYNGDFVFDDHKAIVGNKVVTANKSSGLNLYELLRTDFWGDFIQSDYSHKSYRPVTTLTFRLNYLIAGLDDTKIYHFTNIIIHAINSNLVARIVKLYFPNSENLALYSGIIFGVHPIGSESVASIVGRAELLMAFFFFLSLQETITHPDTITLKFTLLFVLSFFSKEQGIMILPLSILHATLNGNNYYKSIKTGIMMVFFITFRLAINDFKFPKFSLHDNPIAEEKNFFVKVSTLAYIYLLNLKLLVWPLWLSVDYSMASVPLIKTIDDPRLLSLIFIVLGCSVICKQLLSKFNQREKMTNLICSEKRAIIISLVFFTATFFPASHILLKVGFVLAERVLYLPSAAFALLGALILNHLKAKSLFVVIILLLLSKSMQRSLDWKSEEKLYSSSLEATHLNSKLYYNLGKIYASTKRTNLAIESYLKAIEFNQEYSHAMNNLANIYSDIGRDADAELLLLRCLNISTFPFPTAWMNLGITQMRLGKYYKSENSLKMALKVSQNANIYFNLGNLYLKMKQFEEAKEQYIKSVEIDKKHLPAWINLLILIEEQFKCKNFEEIGLEALKYNENNGALHEQMARCYFFTNDKRKAKAYFINAVQLEPQNQLFKMNLNIFYEEEAKLGKNISSN